MADSNSHLTSFQTAYERGCTHLSCTNEALTREPALRINPDADLHALLGAALSRASRLHTLLDLAASMDEGDTRLASTLEPMAEEVQLLLEAIQDRAPRAAFA